LGRVPIEQGTAIYLGRALQAIKRARYRVDREARLIENGEVIDASDTRPMDLGDARQFLKYSEDDLRRAMRALEIEAIE
jgi:hypothetical protein